MNVPPAISFQATQERSVQIGWGLSRIPFLAWDPKIDKDFESNEFYTMILSLQEMTLDIFLKLKKIH